MIRRRLMSLAMSADRIVRLTRMVEEGKQVPLLILRREAWISLRRSLKLWLLLTWRRILRRE